MPSCRMRPCASIRLPTRESSWMMSGLISRRSRLLIRRGCGWVACGVYRRSPVGETAKCLPCSTWARGWMCDDMKVVYMTTRSSVAVVMADSIASR